jgi:cell division transport system permease protein
MAAHLLFEPAFRHQKLGWLFVAIVGIMVYIATFAMAAEAALSSVSLSRNQGIANHLTIEIPAVDDESTQPQDERVKQAVAVLKAVPDLDDVRAIPEDETARLLEPWITDPELLRKLPLPALIDVERHGASSISVDALQEKLRAVVGNAKVDDHAAWMVDVAHLVHSLAILAAFMIALTGVALITAIGLICRAVMATERDTIELLHVMGALDSNIARHFQYQALRLSWPAAVGGFICAVLSLIVLLFFLRHVIDISSLHAGRWFALGSLVILVPLAAVQAAALSARFSVLKLLQSFP